MEERHHEVADETPNPAMGIGISPDAKEPVAGRPREKSARSGLVATSPVAGKAQQTVDGNDAGHVTGPIYLITHHQAASVVAVALPRSGR